MQNIEITKQLLQELQENPQTLIMAEYCKNVKNTVVYNSGNSFATVSVVLGETECCVYSRDESFISHVLATLSGKVKLCGVDTFVTEYLRSSYGFLWETNCDLYVYNGKPLPLTDNFDLAAMDETYALDISNGTPYRADIENVKTCLKIHPSVAAYDNGRPVCWCLLHIEGSLGMLYTLPEYRRKGYALRVMTELCKKVIERGDIPFAYIIQDNVASKSLAPKYNLQYVCKANYFEINI